jgi:hypothetical protein
MTNAPTRPASGSIQAIGTHGQAPGRQSRASTQWHRPLRMTAARKLFHRPKHSMLLCKRKIPLPGSDKRGNLLRSSRRVKGLNSVGTAVTREPAGLVSLRASRWAALIAVGFAVFTDYLIYGAIVPLTPYSPAGHGSDAALSILYGVYSVGVLFSTPAFGMIADRLGYRAVMWLAVGLSVPAILLLWHSDGFTLTLIGRFFQGAASAATWTAGLALIAARYKEQRVQMIGLTLMASTGGSIVGPIMSGVLYQYGGYTLPFVVLCGFALADAAYLLIPES